MSSRNSTYFRELESADFRDGLALRGILQAAAEDYREGFLADNKLLVSAEVFADLLVQAEILIENHFYDAAAVLAGAVLEDGLRRLCATHQIACESTAAIGRINDALYRAGVYTALTQKEITAKAAVRNNAAHGKGGENTPRDVQDLLAYVQRFLAEQLQ